MSFESKSITTIAVVLLLFNIVLPVFVFALNEISIDAEPVGSFEISLDLDELSKLNIDFADAETKTLNFTSYVQFDFNGTTNKKLRVYWDTYGLLSNHDLFKFAQQNVVEKYSDTWLFPSYIEVQVGGQDFIPVTSTQSFPSNQTIINYFNDDYNWTRVDPISIGEKFFITCEKYSNNITQAIQNGEVNITAGTPIINQSTDFRGFISFYWGTLTDYQDYGLPVSLKWIFRIQAILTLLTGVFLARQLIGFT